MLLALTGVEWLAVIQTIVMAIGFVLTTSIWLGGRYQALQKTEDQVDDLPDTLKQMDSEWNALLESANTRWSKKVDDLIAALGRHASRHEVDVLRNDVLELRRRLDAHIDANK